MKNYVQEGKRLTHTAAATIVSGQPVLVGKRLGIATTDIASGEKGSLAMCGVFTVTKLQSAVFAQGDDGYWDNTNSRVTTVSAGNTLAGYAHSAAGSGVVTMELNLNG